MTVTGVNLGQAYNAPPESPSGVGLQEYTHYWSRKSLRANRDKRVFGLLGDRKYIPEHYGKTVKIYLYLAILDDRNVNDQGIDASGAVIANGNLYGSSTDIGDVSGKMPLLGEGGGIVNRVGNTRLEITGDIHAMGIFTQWTAESVNLDTDPEMFKIKIEELMRAAVELDEDMLQIELLQAANVVRYAGNATSEATVTGEGATPSEVSFRDLEALSEILTLNYTPKHTVIAAGSTYVDTITIPAARVMYVGAAVLRRLKSMVDNFGEPAFQPLHKYKHNVDYVLPDEEGIIGDFRIVCVRRMLSSDGVGASVTDQSTIYRHTGGKYDVHNMLVVGSESFATLSFATKNEQGYQVISKGPGKETAQLGFDAFGQQGFTSVRWYYGFVALRPERIGLIKTVVRR